MLQILRQLTPDEMRQVELECGARPGSDPVEILRCLSRLCGATTWGIFPAASDDALLDHAGQRLGMPPLIRGPRAVSQRERAVLTVYLRQAWQMADPERQRRVLDLALEAWDNPMLPCPERMAEDGSSPDLALTLEMFLQQPAGCRALATATARAPLPLPLPHAGPAGGLRLPLGGRSPAGQQALYPVLLILWRARARLLRERRTQRLQLERQLRQLQSLLEARHRDLRATPVSWSLNPASGLSITAAATTSLALHTALAPVPGALIPAAVAGAAGLAWSVAALALRPRPATNKRLSRLSAQVHATRIQFAQVERDIFALETE